MSATPTLAHFLILGALLFAISVVGIFLNRKNVIVLLRRQACDTTRIISTAMKPPTTKASGRLAQNPARTFSILMSSIITTNRNNTITAPT